MTLTEAYNQISEIAGLLHNKGWAEKNAGNFSVRVDMEDDPGTGEVYPLSSTYLQLAGMVFVVTGKGKRMRDIARSPAVNTVIIKINAQGSGYSILSVASIKPTSELPTHLSIHSMISARGSNEKAILHSHVTELIALTQLQEFCNEVKLNELLWKMHPETIMFIPDGIGFVPFNLPGSYEIAHETVKSLRNHPVTIWEKHGVFAIAQDLSDSFDLVDIVAKSAKVFFMCASTGTLPQGLSVNQLNEIKKLSS